MWSRIEEIGGRVRSEGREDPKHPGSKPGRKKKGKQPHQKHEEDPNSLQQQTETTQQDPQTTGESPQQEQPEVQDEYDARHHHKRRNNYRHYRRMTYEQKTQT